MIYGSEDIFSLYHYLLPYVSVIIHVIICIILSWQNYNIDVVISASVYRVCILLMFASVFYSVMQLFFQYAVTYVILNF